MVYQKHPVDTQSLDFLVEGHLLQISRSPVTKFVYHKVPENELRQYLKAYYGRILDQAHSTRNGIFVRLLDERAGEFAGSTRWALIPEDTEFSSFNPRASLPGANSKLLDAIADNWKRVLHDVLRDRQCYFLQDIQVPQRFQGKGASSILVRLPFEEADRQGIPCAVSTSIDGPLLALYEHHGFEIADISSFDLGDYGGHGVVQQAYLIREPNTSNVLTAGILIISDTASADPSADKSGDMLKTTFETSGSGLWRIGATSIVPDSIPAIQSKIESWAGGAGGAPASAFNLILTTGGTGFATKDVTPEAIEPLLERKAPGLVHAMLASSLQVTPFAAMSRPVAGTRGKTVIISVPGSPKGAKENLEAIIKLLPHACQQSAGAHSRELHKGGVKKLEKDAGVESTALARSQGKNSSGEHSHAHDHHHGHGHGHGHGHAAGPHTRPEDRPQPNDPNAGPTARYRESPYPKLTVADAISRILAQTPEPVVIEKAVDTKLVGSILAEDVNAPHPVPAFRASIVDGYAVITKPKSTNEQGTFEVAAVSHAAPGSIAGLEEGKIARITTGAPLPPNARAVVMVEDTVLRKMTEDGKEEAEVEILTSEVKDGENVREVGSDIRQGEVILRKGDKISAVGGELGLLASVGRATVKVYKKPVIGVMSTGDEIVPHDRQGDLRLGEVRDTNRITLTSAIGGWGYEIVDLGIARDAPGDLESTLRNALKRADVIVTTGGVSMGELDLLKPTIERSLGGTIHFGRVAMKPGMPTTFATVPFKSVSGDPKTSLIFSLPGNPASGMVTASLFMRPCIDQYSGVDKARLGQPKAKVVLAADTKSDLKREEYQRAVVWQGEDGRLYGQTTGFQRSSRIGSFNKANALLVVAPGQGVLEKGRVIDALLLAGLEN